METENKDLQETTETKDLTIQEKQALQVLEQFELNYMQCIKCPIVTQCKYCKQKLKVLEDEAKDMAEDIYNEELELDNSMDNTLRAQYKRDQVYQDYMVHRAPEVLKNQNCVYEKKELRTVLLKFINTGYNLNDPRAHIIITELLNNILVVGRANKVFTKLGVILRKETPAGPVYYSNPILKDKIQFSKLIVEATESLDRILKSDESEEIENDFTKLLIKSIEKQQKLGNVIDEPKKIHIVEDNRNFDEIKNSQATQENL